jgi:hypothetical protein
MKNYHIIFIWYYILSLVLQLFLRVMLKRHLHNLDRVDRFFVSVDRRHVCYVMNERWWWAWDKTG